uniref:Uncharacterized protein n=1 Tax=Sphaerodactylus townsendi TaxID=933632 RepID=A0ACB8EP57_9SAUR
MRQLLAAQDLGQTRVSHTSGKEHLIYLAGAEPDAMVGGSWRNRGQPSRFFVVARPIGGRFEYFPTLSSRALDPPTFHQPSKMFSLFAYQDEFCFLPNQRPEEPGHPRLERASSASSRWTQEVNQRIRERDPVAVTAMRAAIALCRGLLNKAAALHQHRPCRSMGISCGLVLKLPAPGGLQVGHRRAPPLEEKTEGMASATGQTPTAGYLGCVHRNSSNGNSQER